ncbi:MAG: peptidoglycan-binding domain-containing protein [Kibdelosporangium sp.]
MKPTLSEILSRLAATDDKIEDVLTGLRPPGEREALKRCAVVRTFDRELFDGVLTPDESPAGWPPFDSFVASFEVERVPRVAGGYRLQQRARLDNWRAWWAGEPVGPPVPADLRALAARLAEHFRAGERSRDLLGQLVLYDQEQAAEVFRGLYAQADQRFDLARCQDLIDVLLDECRAPLLGPDLITLRDQRIAYLTARSLWSTEYLQTGTFLETAGLRRAYDELLAGDGPRVLEMHAPGGRGKTMELRWLISRVFVLKRIPCAKSDFDYLDPVNATRYPLLVLLEAAAQLNQQLPQEPFNAFLESFGWATPLLRRHVTDASRVAAASKRLRTQHTRLAATVPKRFVQTFNNAVGDGPAVMVLDTLEEVHLRPQNDLAGLLRLLRYLHDECPGLRLVLSGRYPVSELGGLPPTVHREPECFSTADADRYLAELRQIGRPEVRAAITDKAAGDPFKLSLLADIVQQRPSLTPAHVQQFEADLIYLILRVIRRIQEPRVRWLLRYGVIPRTLSLEFVREVMQRDLERGLSGDLELDSPGDDVLPDQLDSKVTAFPTSAQGLDLDECWAQLCRYAATSSWVSPVPEDPESLRFHPNVLAPMRRVIRAHPVYASLHLAAVDYFERKAAEDAERWDHWIGEAIYHRFQVDGPDAAGYWRLALDRVDLDDPQRRADLAEQLLGWDYIDRDGDPRPWRDGVRLIAPETVVQARFELASALTQIARMSGVEAADQLWSRAEENFAKVQHSRLNVVPEWRLAYVRAALALRAGELDEAERYLLGALPRTVDLQDLVRLRVLLGEVQLRRGNRAAPETYREALTAAGRLTLRSGRTYVRTQIIKAYQELGRLHEASAELDAARAREPLSAEQEVRLGLLAVELGVASGRLDWAAHNARRVAADGIDARALAAEASVALERRRPVEALELAAGAERVAADYATGTAAATSSVEFALGRELSGLAAGAVARYGQALHALETARSLWHREGDLAAVARCHTHSAILQMREVGNLMVAEQHLTEAAELEIVRGGAAWCATQLARVELLGRQARPHQALDLVWSVIRRLRARHSPPQLLIRAAVEGLAVGLPEDNNLLLELLAEQLPLVSPVSARIVLLHDLDRVPDMHDHAAREKLRALGPLLRTSRDKLPTADQALLDLTLVELDRLVRDRQAAEDRLTAVHHDCRGLRTLFFVREWSRALDRLDAIGGAARPQSTEVQQFVREFHEYPTLCGVFLVERAEGLLGVDDVREARELLKQAEPLLRQAAELETQWHARQQQAMGRVSQTLTDVRRQAYRAAAGAAFGVLGDVIRSWVVESTADAGRKLEESRASVRLAFGNDERLEVATWIPPATEVKKTYRHEIRGLLGPAATEDQVIDTVAERLQHDWRAVGDELGRLMLPEAALAAMTHRFDLRCDVEDRRLNVIPWELARRPDTGTLVGQDGAVCTMYRAVSRLSAYRDEVRYVQTGLNRLVDRELPVDGDLGPYTKQRLISYQARYGLTPAGELGTRVITQLQRDMAPQGKPLVVLAQPGKHNRALSRLYEAHGFEVAVVRDPTLDRLAEVMASVPRTPAVLHLSCGLRESGGGVALTFLAGGWEAEAFSNSRTTDDIPVTSVNRLLAGIPREEFRPLVVLDVDRPSGSADMIFYLLLRNAFAGDLFGLGRCAGVLGTGLAGHDGQEMYDSMIRSLAAGKSLGETATALRALVRDDTRLDRVLPFAGTSLHTHLPWLRLVLGR